MKNLNNLPKDIYSLFEEGHKPSSDNLEQLAKDVKWAITRQLNKQDQEARDTLRISMLGKKCNRQVWYMKHKKDQEEKLKGHTKIKFLFGDLLEALLVFLTKEAGYRLTGVQDRLNLDGVEGTRDGVIEGTTVDFKSASSYSFRKFEEPGGLLQDDPFGYLHQLAGYTEADKTAEVKDQVAAFVAIDKQNGKIAVAKYQKKDLPDVRKRISELKGVLDLAEEPVRDFEPVPEGKSGNERLNTYCSYCPFKHYCHRDANNGRGLRIFAYSSKPLFLTKVVVEPKVPEIHKEEVDNLE